MLLSVSALFQFLTFSAPSISGYVLPLVKAWKNGATNPTDSSLFQFISSNVAMYLPRSLS